MKIELDRLTITMSGRPFIADLSLDIRDGSFVAVVGPNGSGKSTLLRAMYRAIRPDSGRVLIGGTDVAALRPRDAALLRAVVTQHQTGNESLLVRDVVATGRHAHQRWLSAESSVDREWIRASLERCGAGHLHDRRYATLSGGERQRVLLARALSQDAQVLLLDEPTNHLDVAAQHDLLGLLDAVPLTRVVVLHDLTHAIAHADAIVVVEGGRIRAVGDPVAVLTDDLTRDVFGCRSTVIANPLTGRPHLITAPGR